MSIRPTDIIDPQTDETPSECTCTWNGECKACIAKEEAEVKAAIESGVPFSLSCSSCDAGMDIGGIVQAVAEGWQDIGFEPDGLSWNFLGNCPDCLREQAQKKGVLFI